MAFVVRRLVYLDFEPGEALDPLIGASIHYRIAIGPNAGQKALTPRTVPAPSEPFASTLLARQPGFSLHAATCREANQRDKLEKLRRYITRPAIANERLSTNERGQVIYRFKQPFRVDDVFDIEEWCDIYGTNLDFGVRSYLGGTRGRACVVASGRETCALGDFSRRDHTLNGERYTLRATRVGNTWTINEVDPAPPD